VSTKGDRMKTLGKLTWKLYRCVKCGSKEDQQTNHWGEIYNIKCKGLCGTYTVFECMEDPPKGYEKPPPWKMVKLDEIFKHQPLTLL